MPILEPNAMSLATVSSQGQPSLRTVLLKSHDANGFVFFTNLESCKLRETSMLTRSLCSRSRGWRWSGR